MLTFVFLEPLCITRFRVRTWWSGSWPGRQNFNPVRSIKLFEFESFLRSPLHGYHCVSEPGAEKPSSANYILITASYVLALETLLQQWYFSSRN